MTTLKWTIRDCQLPLRQPLVIAQGPITLRHVLQLQCSGDGSDGWGEASPLPGFGGESLALCRALLQAIPTVPRDALAYADGLLATAPCAASAISGALACRSSVHRGLPLAQAYGAALGVEPIRSVRCNALLNNPDPKCALPLAAAGFTAFKWKSSGDPQRDAAAAVALRKALGPQARLRLDVNGGWDLAQAEAFAEAAVNAAMDYVEQPLPRGQEAQLAALSARKLRVALDESVRSVQDVEEICQQTWAEVLVLKPQWMGGFAGLRQAVFLARARHPRRIVVSSTLDSAVGRAHALHAACALGLGGEHHGLATGDLLAKDVAVAEDLSGGVMRIGSSPGLGFVPREINHD